MTHPDDARLNDYADGLLDLESAATVAHHLERCMACDARVERIRALTAELAALPREITPERDLRPPAPSRRAARPARSARPPRPARPARPWLRAAAVAGLIVAGAAVARVVSTRDPAPDEASALATEAGLVPAESYADATRDLRTVVEEHRGDVPEEASRVVDRNLEAVERAIRELEQASARLPADPDLARMLDQQYRTRLELLRSAVALVES